MRHPVLAAVAATSIGVLTAVVSLPAWADEPATIVVKDGATQPVFDYAKAINEEIWVEVPLDTDGDGTKDRVHLDITRPGETETAGLKVGSLMIATPYMGDFVDAPYHSVDPDRLPQEKDAPAARARRALGDSRAADTRAEDARAGGKVGDDDEAGYPEEGNWEYFVRRGYAMITMESLGTARSTGCPDSGGPHEAAATRAVIDWLGGSGRAYDAAGTVVAADWSARAVGMYGVSYNGTLPLAAAVTGRSALKTVIPMSAVSNWYDEYRANGLVVAPYQWQGEDVDIHSRIILSRANPEVCAAAMDRLTREQDRVTGDYSPFWAERDYASKAAQIEASVFIVQGMRDWNVKTKQGIQLWEALGRHGVDRKLWLYDGDHGSASAPSFFPTMRRWIDHYIYQVDSGISDEPPVIREDSAATVVEKGQAWPVPGSAPVMLPLAEGRKRTDTFVDNGREVVAEKLLEPAGNSLAYRTPALTAPVRLSGTPRVALDVSIDNRTAANLTALLVDYGPAGTEPVIVTRGWTDPQNRTSLTRSEPVTPGRSYRLRWDMQPQDHTFAAGHRIGVVVLSTDYDYTLRPLPGTQVSVRPTASTVQLPLVGGRGALKF
ncbi:CocE/NonD family hydrolase [Jidongwangia harbinensis]|uniref:CocE/NonD family hydrolase n=1 Tax=Jidongwangia harbinensis TaxID=2878561 RepID=UPI001CD92E5E|nr:CocE/NonD family hydrolase [Jidongwangia harbinensis]MCA2216005.1 Xaa-Pro dipeptidyl-peptidase [Jidongwangia harbinensis]